MAKNYDKDTDYQALIEAAAASGDYASAAQYEQQRNAKIADMGLDYQQTNNYAGYLYDGGNLGDLGPMQYQGAGRSAYAGAGTRGYDANENFDYSDYLTDLMGAGSTDYDYLERLLNERTNKAVSTQGLGQYANDAFAQSVRDYIARGREANNDIDIDAILAQINGVTGSAPTLKDNWYDMADMLGKVALGMSYEDWLASTQGQALADRYRQQGQRSMQDVLGQMAARTGGLASSYAGTVADQQYNDYMAMLEDVARQMYASERGDAIENAQLAMNYSDRDYQRYLDQLSQYNGDRNYAYQVLQDAIAGSRYGQEWQNTLEQQALANQRTAQADARDRIATFLAAGGSIDALDDALIRDSGYTQAELAAMGAYYGGGQQSSTPRRSPSPRSEEPEDDSDVGYDFRDTDYYTSGLHSAIHPTGNGSATANSRTTVSYNSDTGKITFNGIQYNDTAAGREELVKAINSTDLSADEEQKVIAQLKKLGFDVN